MSHSLPQYFSFTNRIFYEMANWPLLYILLAYNSFIVNAILNGKDAEFGPKWIVFIRNTKDQLRSLPDAQTQHCAGSIVAHNLILTAAHCIFDKIPSHFEVVGDKMNLTANQSGP